MPQVTDSKGTGAPTGAAAIKSIVENANAEDDNRKTGGDAGNGDDGAGDDAGDSDESDEEDIPDEEDDAAAADSGEGDDSDADDAGDDSDDSGDPKGDEGKTTRRFSQFAGDGKTETYLSNLEKGYENSSKEAIRLNQELGQAKSRVDAIMRAAGSDPELAEKLNKVMDEGGGDSGSGDAGSPAENPFVSDLKTRWTEKSDQEIEQFIEANPEVATDPKIAEDVKHWMNVFSTDQLQRTGKLMTGGEAMAAAYRHLGLENKLEKQNLAQGAKRTAAPTRPQSKGKKAPAANAKAFTSAQIEMARRMGKADPEKWLRENAS